MQTEFANRQDMRYQTPDARAEDAIAQPMLMDGSSGTEARIAFFNSHRQLIFLGSMAEYNQLLGNDPSSPHPSRPVYSCVAEIDSLLIPEACYDGQYREVYESYLIDDGVTPARSLSCPKTEAVLVYRPFLGNLSPSMLPPAQSEPVPVTTLLIEGVVPKFSLPTLGIHLDAGEAFFYFSDLGRLRSNQRIRFYSEPGFNATVLKLMTDWEIDPDKVQVLVSGEVEDFTIPCLSKYFPEVKLADPAAITGLPVPAELREHAHRLLPIYLLAAYSIV